jgi:hypothetical protein
LAYLHRARVMIDYLTLYKLPLSKRKKFIDEAKEYYELIKKNPINPLSLL